MRGAGLIATLVITVEVVRIAIGRIGPARVGIRARLTPGRALIRICHVLQAVRMARLLCIAHTITVVRAAEDTEPVRVALTERGGRAKPVLTLLVPTVVVAGDIIIAAVCPIAPAAVGRHTFLAVRRTVCRDLMRGQAIDVALLLRCVHAIAVLRAANHTRRVLITVAELRPWAQLDFTEPLTALIVADEILCIAICRRIVPAAKVSHALLTIPRAEHDIFVLR